MAITFRGDGVAIEYRGETVEEPFRDANFEACRRPGL
jgi:hypothetical protein